MLMHHISTRAAAILTACLVASLPAFADDAEEAAPAVATETVEQGPFRVDVTLSGVFEAAETVEIKIETEEWTDLEVVEAVPHGSLVQAGDLLIQLASDELDDKNRASDERRSIGTTRDHAGSTRLTVERTQLAAATRRVRSAAV